MGRVFKPTYTNKAGKRVTVASWYAEWWGADGKPHRKRIGPNKADANAFLAAQEAREAKLRAGIIADPSMHPDRTRPLAELLMVYMARLKAINASKVYRSNVEDYLNRIFTACEWRAFVDITPDTLLKFLADRREQKGNSAATLNSYLRTARGFSRWLAGRVGALDPLREIPRFAETDRRRSKRILTDEEFAALLTATEAYSPKRNCTLRGPDRAMLYRVAAYTGLRASELASLTKDSFRLDASPPVVVVAAKSAKNRTEEPIPIPAHVVALLRPWLKKKRKGEPVWPGRWAELRHFGEWLQTDLKRAGVSARDAQGRKATPHGLRRRYVVSVIKTGAKIHEVRRLARHKDVKTTLDYYTDESMADLGAIADRL